MRRQNGLVLVDAICVSLAIGVCAASLGLARAKELGKRAICGTNLKNMANALGIYTTENAERYPWMRSNNSWDTTATGTNSGLAPSDKLGRSVSSLLYMLVRDGQGPGLFVCPSTTKTVEFTDARPGELWDFKSSNSLSYSYQLPITSDKGVVNGVGFNSPEDLAVVADETPLNFGRKLPDWSEADKLTLKEKRQGMSPNHWDGQAIQVLYFGGHVQTHERADVGMDRDNIYSASNDPAGPSRSSTITPSLKTHLSDADSALWGPVAEAPATRPAGTPEP